MWSGIRIGSTLTGHIVCVWILCSSDRTSGSIGHMHTYTATLAYPVSDAELVLIIHNQKSAHNDLFLQILYYATYIRILFPSSGLTYAMWGTPTRTRTVALSIPQSERRTGKEGGKLPAVAAAFRVSPHTLMAAHNNSSIQSRRGGGDEEAKHGDGDTKNVISSSHSRVLVQYGSGISGDRRSKSL